MFCGNCGKKLEDDWKNCPFCGWETGGAAVKREDGDTGIGTEGNLEYYAVAPAQIDGNTSSNTFSAEMKKKKGILKELATGIIVVPAILFIIGTFIIPEGEDTKNQASSEVAKDLGEVKEAEDEEKLIDDMTEEYLGYINSCEEVTLEELFQDSKKYDGKDIIAEGSFYYLNNSLAWFTKYGNIKIQHDSMVFDEDGKAVGKIETGDYGVVAGKYHEKNKRGQPYIEAKAIVLVDEEGRKANSEGKEEEESEEEEEGSEEKEGAHVSNTQEYIFPDSNSRYLSEEEVRSLDAGQQRIARNEIFARHGYIFNDGELSQYFNSTSWYHGTVPSDQFQADRVFNDFERENVALINRIEAQGGEGANGQAGFIGKKGVYLNPLPANGTTYKINVLEITGDTLEFEFGFFENDYVITTEKARILDNHTAQIDFGGLAATLTWTDAEHVYVTNDHGYIGGTDSGSIIDGTDGVSYEWASGFN